MRGFSISRLELRQVHGQVVGEPAVPGPEGLGLGGLGVPHDAEPIAEGLEGHNPVIADLEPLPAAGEVDVLGLTTKHPGVRAMVLNFGSTTTVMDISWRVAFMRMPNAREKRLPIWVTPGAIAITVLERIESMSCRGRGCLRRFEQNSLEVALR